MNLVQHVNIPRHTEGHTLDLIVTRNGELSIKNLKPDMSIVSDHYGLVCTLSVPKPHCATKVSSCRKFKQIDIGKFKNDLMNSSLYVERWNRTGWNRTI